MGFDIPFIAWVRTIMHSIFFTLGFLQVILKLLLFESFFFCCVFKNIYVVVFLNLDLKVFSSQLFLFGEWREGKIFK